ncbi:Acg family FMN-binding oxidoreductase [Kribbella lupini]|uniref:Nitroreductase family protein n=1 Tax=Kribbella lupini TaxID=291602 RepID=A0ABP4LG68_9ACTN
MTGPADGIRDELLRAAVAAPSMHNTQPWKFRFRGWVVEVHRDQARELPAEDPDRRMLHVSLGAAILNLRVAAAYQGFGAAVQYVLDRTRPDLVAEIELTGVDADTAPLRVLESAVWARRTNRQPYVDRPVPDEVRELLDVTARLEGAELEWLDGPSRLKWVQLATIEAGELDAVEQARTTERRRWVGGERPLDGVPSRNLGPRPVDGVTARDLAVTPVDAIRPAARFEADPQLVVLSTAHDGPVDWLRAGQAMERVLLEATAHGVSTSLLNQAIEHDTLRWLVGDPLGAWRRPQSVIRFGYGPQVPPAPRRPIADVLLD